MHRVSFGQVAKVTPNTFYDIMANQLDRLFAVLALDLATGFSVTKGLK
jgi:hypothetical protein